MSDFVVMAKPVGSLCNMQCDYCYYLNADNGSAPPHMSDEILETYIRSYMNAVSGKVISFTWHGGEPTLAGLDFFKKAVSLQKKYLPAGKECWNNLQTNGLYLDDAWCRFLKENRFDVGVSIDGYKLNMDAFRFDEKKQSVFDTIMANVKLLRKYKVDFNVLTVVTSDLSKHAKGLFRFYKENRFDYIQLIPCLPGFHESTDIFALTPETYADFYNAFFDEWIKEVRKGKMYSVNLFENLYGMAHGQIPYQCGMLGRCTAQFVIESNGDTYPCDFYCLDEYLMGNLHEKSFEELRNQEVTKRFIQTSGCMKKPCETCRYKNMCFRY